MQRIFSVFDLRFGFRNLRRRDTEATHNSHIDEPVIEQDMVADTPKRLSNNVLVNPKPSETQSQDMESSLADLETPSSSMSPFTNADSLYAPSLAFRDVVSDSIGHDSSTTLTNLGSVVPVTSMSTTTHMESSVASANLPHPVPDPGTIRGTMPLSEVVACLGDHGCRDVTNELDVFRSSEYPCASGGFGDVYRGVLHDGRRVSLKCIRLLVDSTDNERRELKRAARELYVWSKCQHQNVLGLIGLAQFRGQIAMVSPWMENGNLPWYLSRHPDLKRYNLCTQIAAGVAYLHEQGIIHGDIKGANILVSEQGVLKLTDFGNAVLREYTLKFTNTTGTPNISPRWTAPEVVLGETSHTAEADVYALGMTFLEAITGMVPYDGLGDIQVYGKIMQKIPPVRPEKYLPSNDDRAELMWSLLTSCWSYNAKDRPGACDVRDMVTLWSEEDQHTFSRALYMG